MKWFKLRETKDIAVEAVTPAKLGAALKALEKAGVSLVIIDTPGTESAAAETAMKASDFCIIPARPNAFDLWASETTRKTLRTMKREFAFLLNQCPPSQQSARVEEGAKALEAMGGLLTPMISSRVDYQEAARHGLGVTELHGSGAAADEMRKLWKSVKRRIAKGGKAATRKAA